MAPTAAPLLLVHVPSLCAGFGHFRSLCYLPSALCLVSISLNLLKRNAKSSVPDPTVKRGVPGSKLVSWFAFLWQPKVIQGSLKYLKTKMSPLPTTFDWAHSKKLSQLLTIYMQKTCIEWRTAWPLATPAGSKTTAGRGQEWCTHFILGTLTLTPKHMLQCPQNKRTVNLLYSCPIVPCTYV